MPLKPPLGSLLDDLLSEAAGSEGTTPPPAEIKPTDSNRTTEPKGGEAPADSEVGPFVFTPPAEIPELEAVPYFGVPQTGPSGESHRNRQRRYLSRRGKAQRWKYARSRGGLIAEARAKIRRALRAGGTLKEILADIAVDKRKQKRYREGEGRGPCKCGHAYAIHQPGRYFGPCDMEDCPCIRWEEYGRGARKEKGGKSRT